MNDKPLHVILRWFIKTNKRKKQVVLPFTGSERSPVMMEELRYFTQVKVAILQ